MKKSSLFVKIRSAFHMLYLTRQNYFFPLIKTSSYESNNVRLCYKVLDFVCEYRCCQCSRVKRGSGNIDVRINEDDVSLARRHITKSWC